MLVVNIGVILLFVVLGITFSKDKGVNLVSGYNTMSKSEREKIDTKALCKYMSRMMFLLAACWCILSIGLILEKMWLFWCGFGIFLGVTIFFVIFLNTGNRLEKKQ